ncbi:MAG: glycosyltransferase family 2 protein [bacterium]
MKREIEVSYSERASHPKYRRLSTVIPVYNGAATIVPLVDELVHALEQHYDSFQIVLVNDGSPDNSHERALECVSRYPNIVTYIRLARNFGEHNAVMCGLRHANGDCVAIIDDDFQTPPSEIKRLVNKLEQGFDVVYSRYETKHHAWYRNLGSRFNGWIATRTLSKPRHLYLSSFKVLSRFLVEAITQYEDPYPYIDALILSSTDAIGSEACRHAATRRGHSNYTLRRLVRLWLNMCPFSLLPLRISTYLGFATSALALTMALFFTISHAVGGILDRQPIPPGWASVIVSVTFFSGLQLSVLGMIGEYLGRVYMTQNKYPQFVIRQLVQEDPERGQAEAHDNGCPAADSSSKTAIESRGHE